MDTRVKPAMGLEEQRHVSTNIHLWHSIISGAVYGYVPHGAVVAAL